MADAATITMNVSLPEPLKRFVDSKVSSGLYGSVSEFVREAIREKLAREEERQRAETLLAARLLQGLESGAAMDFDAAYVAKRRAELEAQLGAGKKAE